MLTTKMDNEKVMQRYQEYKKAREEREQTEKTLQAQKTETQAFWQAKREIPGKVVTTRKPHVCCSCKQTIAAGEKATVKARFTNVAVGGGWTPGFETQYYCSACRKIQEA